MDVLDVVLAAASLLLLAAGATKVARPGEADRALRLTGLPSRPSLVRGLGVVEIGVATVVIVAGDHAAAPIALAALYAGFAAFVVVALWKRVPLTSCGCFGASGVTPTPVHAAVNAGCAAVGVLRALDPHDPALDVVRHGGADAVVMVLGAAALAASGYWLFTRVGDTRSTRSHRLPR